MSSEYRVVRQPRHRCDIGSPLGRGGEIVVCLFCGRWWRAVEPGNPQYATWRPVLLARLLRLLGGKS